MTAFFKPQQVRTRCFISQFGIGLLHRAGGARTSRIRTKLTQATTSTTSPKMEFDQIPQSRSKGTVGVHQYKVLAMLQGAQSYVLRGVWAVNATAGERMDGGPWLSTTTSSNLTRHLRRKPHQVLLGSWRGRRSTRGAGLTRRSERGSSAVFITALGDCIDRFTKSGGSRISEAHRRKSTTPRTQTY